MAVCAIKSVMELGVRFILTPERYNPKRQMQFSQDDGVELSKIATLSDEIVASSKTQDQEYYLVNTGDAYGGALHVPSFKERLNSNKKILRRGDVVISRLRPYLKQIAYVDVQKDDGLVVASTEFYVLRSKNDESLAFLVPFLSSKVAQSIFANSVEGSQHPRFKDDALLNLIVPRRIFEERNAISQKVERAVQSFRAYERGIAEATSEIDVVF